MELLRKVHALYLQPAAVNFCQLMTDDGSENFGEVQSFLQLTNNPSFQHIIAQRDVEFSNSMIEAANKNIKYRFLYHKHIAGFNSLCQYMNQAIEHYNNRPHHILGGLTSFGVLNGNRTKKDIRQQEMATAKTTRIAENKQQKCCSYSF